MIKRISILGTESSGKTKLTQDLATYFSTNFVIDYSNLIFKSLGKKPKPDEYIEITRSRESLEVWLKKISKEFLFFDTCDIHTAWESLNEFPKSDIYLKILENIKKCDLYLITKSDKRLEKLIKKCNVNYIFVEDEDYFNMRKKSIIELEKLK